MRYGIFAVLALLAATPAYACDYEMAQALRYRSQSVRQRVVQQVVEDDCYDAPQPLVLRQRLNSYSDYGSLSLNSGYRQSLRLGLAGYQQSFRQPFRLGFGRNQFRLPLFRSRFNRSPFNRGPRFQLNIGR